MERINDTEKQQPTGRMEETHLAQPEVIHHRPGLSERVSDLDYKDAKDRYQLEAQDNGVPHSASHTSSLSSTEAHKRTISWEAGDAENPYNWSKWQKLYVVLVGTISALNSTFGSSLPAQAMPYIADYFHVTNQSQLVLPISIYLVGYVCGPLLYGPLSESYGRKIILVPTYCLFVVFTLGCALAPTWAGLNVFRFLCGVVASAPMALVGGLYADVYDDPVARGRAMSTFMAATGFGPLFSPILAGFISPVYGWRWTFWVGLIIAGVCWFPIVVLPETYGPILLARRAKKLRNEGKDVWAPIELEKKGWKQMITVVLTRPIRMLLFEWIVASTCLYCALIYAIFYMYFEAYPIVFQGIYGMSSGVSGLMFLPIGVGMLVGAVVFVWYDGFLIRAKAAGKAWTKQEEYRRLPLACLGGPLIVIGLFWLGWTSSPNIPWVVPFLAGIPFGAGFVLIFMALINYLTDAYQIFAASAMAASSCTRSIFGATLPFAATPMYEKLGVGWASSLLGFLSLLMCAIPVLFLKYGDLIRRKSKFCTYLRELKEAEARKLANEHVFEKA